MKAFSTRIRVGAPAALTWSVLTDAPAYPTWNTTVARVDGRIEPGGRIVVHPADGGGRAFPVRVATFDPPRRMVWIGAMPFGLFRGTRTFELTSPSPDETEFSMREVFSGPLAPLIGRSIPDLQPAFDAFAACLKRRLEGAKTPHGG